MFRSPFALWAPFCPFQGYILKKKLIFFEKTETKSRKPE